MRALLFVSLLLLPNLASAGILDVCQGFLDFGRHVTGTSTPESKARRMWNELQTFWAKQFKDSGFKWRQPKLVLYTEVCDTACGEFDSDSGPFYCPEDDTTYIDLSFFDEIAKKRHIFGEAFVRYVLSHEMGHHVAILFGVDEKLSSVNSCFNSGAASAKIQPLTSKTKELTAEALAGYFLGHREPKMSPSDLERQLYFSWSFGDDVIERVFKYDTSHDPHGTGEERKGRLAQGIVADSPHDVISYSYSTLDYETQKLPAN